MSTHEQNRSTGSAQLDNEKGSTLLKLARSEIATKLGHDVSSPAQAGWLAEPGASFVTLTRQGELRGCIGTLEAHRPLGLDVRENAVAAAFRDPRFMPLTRVEFDEIRVEVSVLSPSEILVVASEEHALAILRPNVDGVVFGAIRVEVSLLSPTEGLYVQDEAAALAALRPNVDGVVFEYRHYRSTFLPQVWEQLPEPAEFMAHLKRKAGLPMDFWAEEVRLSRYTVSKWKESSA